MPTATFARRPAAVWRDLEVNGSICYHLLRRRGIERYLCLVLIAHLLLTHLALDAPDAKAKLKSRADLRLPSVPQLQQTLRRRLWNHVLDGLAKNKATCRAAHGNRI